MGWGGGPIRCGVLGKARKKKGMPAALRRKCGRILLEKTGRREREGLKEGACDTRREPPWQIKSAQRFGFRVRWARRRLRGWN